MTCATQVAQTPAIPITGSMQVQPITLRLDTYDDTGTPRTPYILEFANQVNTLSGGNLTIEPTNAVDSEQEVIQHVLMGGYDLGLVASRAWDTETLYNPQASLLS